MVDVLALGEGFLSKLLYATLALAVGYVVGKVSGFLIRRFSVRIGLDGLFRRTSVGRALLRSGYTAGDFLGLFVKWVIYIVAILQALIILDIPQISPAAQWVFGNLPNLISGILVLIIGLIFIDWISEYFRRSYPGNDRLSQSMFSFVGDVIRFILYYMVITIALRQMGIDVTILYLFANAIAWAIAIALGVAMGIVLAIYLREPLRKLMERALATGQGSGHGDY